MQTASAVPSCPPAVPPSPMSKRRRKGEIRTRPDHHHPEGKFVGEYLVLGVRILHKNGQEVLLSLPEIIEGMSGMGAGSPLEVIDWLYRRYNGQTPANSGPSGPDHSTESGHGHRRDLA